MDENLGLSEVFGPNGTIATLSILNLLSKTVFSDRLSSRTYEPKLRSHFYVGHYLQLLRGVTLTLLASKVNLYIQLLLSYNQFVHLILVHFFLSQYTCASPGTIFKTRNSITLYMSQCSILVYNPFTDPLLETMASAGLGVSIAGLQLGTILWLTWTRSITNPLESYPVPSVRILGSWFT